ncbi:MAG: hypothetical protein H0W84_04795 [Bacteroidetes bacterium]|nr:hypothetical protein [Bacteroidota bacterium]
MKNIKSNDNFLASAYRFGAQVLFNDFNNAQRIEVGLAEGVTSFRFFIY